MYFILEVNIRGGIPDKRRIGYRWEEEERKSQEEGSHRSNNGKDGFQKEDVVPKNQQNESWERWPQGCTI